MFCSVSSPPKLFLINLIIQKTPATMAVKATSQNTALILKISAISSLLLPVFSSYTYSNATTVG